MNVSLTAQLEKWIQEKVASGRYQTASEVIREALRLLETQEELRETRLEQLRKEIAVGVQQLDEGRGIDGDKFFDELARGQRSDKD